jgi:hypothetical protein
MTGEQATVKQAANKTAGIVYGEKAEYAYSSNNYFNTDQAMGTTPTLTFTVSGQDGRPVKNFWLDSVKFYFDVNGGVHTYRLYLLEDNSADDVQQFGDIAFDSAGSKAEATAYRWSHSGGGAEGAGATVDAQLPRLVRLATNGTIYYMIDWSADPSGSSVQGYIKLRGRPLLGEKEA